VQAMRSANVRADAIVFNSALSAYARNRLTLWKPRALAAARHARAAPSDTRNVAGAGDKLSQRARRRDRVKLGGECVRATGRRCGRPRANAAFHATLKLSAHHGLLMRTSVSVRRRALSMLLGHGVLGHEPLSVCEVA
jgi:hypothetical protein